MVKWKQHRYGSYEKYVEAQEAGNIKKLNSHAGTGIEVMQEISKRIPNARSILCHGTRGGQEQKFFIEQYPDAYVIGSEISSTAWQIDHTIQWDFSKVNEDWVNKFDIVYSNSFDHSICPEDTIDVWMDQLTENGSLIMELHVAKDHQRPTAMDPLAYSRKDILDLLESKNLKVFDEWPSPKFGSGKYKWGRPTIQVKK